MSSVISTAATRRPCAEVRSVAIRGGRKAKRPIFAADEEGIESVGAVGAVFKEVFFGLRQLLAGFVFAVIAKRFRRNNPLRPLETPVDCTARIKSSLFERLKNGMRRGRDACIASFSTRKNHPKIFSKSFAHKEAAPTTQPHCSDIRFGVVYGWVSSA